MEWKGKKEAVVDLTCMQHSITSVERSSDTSRGGCYHSLESSERTRTSSRMKNRLLYDAANRRAAVNDNKGIYSVFTRCECIFHTMHCIT
jgi:hypothetical protein